uniref:Uncharacterized protein n=1 Tax=Echinococcus granulosus TaxID=6210 RepID=A0A068WXC0_ECHGR|nr:hypothetical protein EgrG_002036200 [Echinococcus granulosus]
MRDTESTQLNLGAGKSADRRPLKGGKKCMMAFPFMVKEREKLEERRRARSPRFTAEILKREAAAERREGSLLNGLKVSALSVPHFRSVCVVLNYLKREKEEGGGRSLQHSGCRAKRPPVGEGETKWSPEAGAQIFAI